MFNTDMFHPCSAGTCQTLSPIGAMDLSMVILFIFNMNKNMPSLLDLMINNDNFSLVS